MPSNRENPIRNKIYRRSTALKQNKEMKEILPFATQYQPSISNLKEALLKH